MVASSSPWKRGMGVWAKSQTHPLTPAEAEQSLLVKIQVFKWFFAVDPLQTMSCIAVYAGAECKRILFRLFTCILHRYKQKQKV